MKATKWQARTRQELIIEVWEALDCESVGERELLAIQHELRQTLGAGAVESPAAIARSVADEGAVLRHPEVSNCDTQWRTRSLAVIPPQQLDFSSLAAAAASLKKIHELLLQAQGDSNEQNLRELREAAIQAGREAQLVARSKIVTEEDRKVAREIVEWIRVWLQQPELFDDWLSLRQRSPEYRKKFGL
ncbi:MAG: hypothetical protein ACR2H6_06390 [Pyrinomonadaceae bacterium]